MLTFNSSSRNQQQRFYIVINNKHLVESENMANVKYQICYHLYPLSCCVAHILEAYLVYVHLVTKWSIGANEQVFCMAITQHSHNLTLATRN